MSVTIATSTQPSTWLQRLTGSEPRTVVREESTTTITSRPGGSFDLKTALRNGGIGAAVAGVLGGVSLLGKVAIPLIGTVGSVAGLAKLAGVGGAIGLATAALPLIAPKVKESPAARAALLGAGIGAAAGAILPLMPIWLGAGIGAGVGLLVHSRRNQTHDYPLYPGYQAYPGYQPYGVQPGAGVPNGLVPVTPNYGAYAGTAMNPYANPSGYGAVQAGYGVPGGYGMPGGYGVPGGYGIPGGYGMPAGYGMLPAQAGAAPAGAIAPAAAVAQPVAAPAPGAASKPTAGSPKFRNAKTFTDGTGNLRQVGTGKILKPAAGSAAAAPTSTLAAAGIQQPNLGMAGYAMQPNAMPTAQPAAQRPGSAMANGTTPLPDATHVVSGIQPASLPVLPGS